MICIFQAERDMRTWAMTGLAGLMLVLLVANVKADYYDDYLVQDLYKRLSQVNILQLLINSETIWIFIKNNTVMLNGSSHFEKPLLFF